MLWGALALASGSLGVAFADETDDPDGTRRAAYIGLGMGAGAFAAGVPLLISGVIARRKYTRWTIDAEVGPPQTGNGFLVGGAMLAAIGTSNLVLGGIADPPATLSLVFGGIEVAAGAALIAVGASRRRRYRTWLTSHHLTVRPSFAPTRNGGVAGVVGRF